MGRIARVVVSGCPHHITQRGNRRQPTFFCDDDYAEYKRLMAQWCDEHRVAIWAYCLMPNHVHLVAVPRSADGLRLAIGEAHRRYTRRVNFREGWRGHLWQGRFGSFVMDRGHLGAAVRYVERNPVRAGLVRRAEDWPWSSAAAHLAGADDGLVTVGPMLRLVGDWRRYLREPDDEELVSSGDTILNSRPIWVGRASAGGRACAGGGPGRAESPDPGEEKGSEEKGTLLVFRRLAMAMWPELTLQRNLLWMWHSRLRLWARPKAAFRPLCGRRTAEGGRPTPTTPCQPVCWAFRLCCRAKGGAYYAVKQGRSETSNVPFSRECPLFSGPGLCSGRPFGTASVAGSWQEPEEPGPGISSLGGGYWK